MFFPRHVRAPAPNLIARQLYAPGLKTLGHGKLTVRKQLSSFEALPLEVSSQRSGRNCAASGP